MVVLLTCKNEEDPIKNRGARVFTTLYINFSDVQGQITLVLVVVSGRNLNSSKLSHTVYPVTPNGGMFYQRGCKHLRRGNTQGKKTCNLRISIVPISNITFQTLCKRAFL